MNFIASFFAFFSYFVTEIVLLGIFVWMHTKITPHNDWNLIQSGNIPVSIVMAGTMLGFTIPVVTLSYFGVNWLDFVIWSVVAGLIQLLLFRCLHSVLPLHFVDDKSEEFSEFVRIKTIETKSSNTARAIIYAIVSICVGMFNAFSHIPPQS